MRTTVHYASNRKLSGAPDSVASYGDEIVPPPDPTAITYGTAFIENVDVPSNAQGDVAEIADTALGRFPRSALDDLSQPDAICWCSCTVSTIRSPTR